MNRQDHKRKKTTASLGLKSGEELGWGSHICSIQIQSNVEIK